MPSTDLSDLADDAVMARARAGDREAFGVLLDRHVTAALRVAAVISGSTEEAHDIVQDAFIRVHRGLATHRGTGSVRSWVLRVVANEAKNHVRGRVRRLHRDDRHAGLQLRDGPDVEAAALAHLEHEELAAALSRLGENDRAVLGCRFLADLSERETAAVLGVRLGTVKSRTARAVGRLRIELEEGAR